MRPLCLIFFFLLAAGTAMAVKAPSRPITVMQPDGRTITLYISGDEFRRRIVTADGTAVAKDESGFFRPVQERTPGNVVQLRKSSMRAAAVKSAGRAYVPTDVRVLVIPVCFADVDFSVTDPTAHFHNMLNAPGYSDNGGTGSAKDYFEANMPGYTFTFDVTAPVRLSREYSYYGENDISVPNVINYDMRLNELVQEACSLASASVSFPVYDRDGDGQADYIFFYLAGYNEAESGDDGTVWPQTYNISSEGIRVNGIRIGLFGCSSELSGSDLGIEGGEIPSGIGTFCHEFGHYLGLVDLYDTDYGNGGTSNCLWGKLSLMDEGSYNNSGRTPPYFCAIDREQAGVISYIDAETGTEVSLSPLHAGGEVLRVTTSTAGEYYLFEYRTESGWDSYIEGQGMVAYHVDRSDNIAGDITASVRWSTNLVNAYALHECADLVEAYPQASHISQVFFPGQAGIDEFSAAWSPALIAWDGTPAGLRLTEITDNGDALTLRIEEDSTEILLSPMSCHIEAWQNKALMEWRCGRPGTYTWAIAWLPEGSGTEPLRDTAYAQSYTFTGLTPNTEYICSIHHVGEHNNGDTVSLRFSTEPLSSPYPYLSLRRRYAPGDTVRLVINNITEPVASVDWYIDGSLIPSDSYVFRREGSYRMEVILHYSTDGSSETLTRTLNVSDIFKEEDYE